MAETSYAVKIRSDKASLFKAGKPMLSTLDMELTERCNNNCIHCYINLPADDFRAKQNELPTDIIKGILKEAATLGCLSVRFTGGEPLLREDFEDIYLFTRKLGMKVAILTNATLLTPHLTKLLKRIPPLEPLEISVYGMKKRSYEAITRSPGSFEAAWQGINLLLGKKIPFIVKGALLPPNKTEHKELELWAADLPWMHGPPVCSMFFDLRCRLDSNGKNKIIKRLRVSPAEGLTMITRNEDEYIQSMKAFLTKYTAAPDRTLFSCGAGVGSGCIDAYGHFQICMSLNHPDTVYNLKDGSLKDALTRFFPKIRKTQAKSYAYLTRCSRCFLRNLCDQCPARSWAEHGTLDTPVDYFCEIAHVQARHLGLLEKNEMAWNAKGIEERIKRFVDQAQVRVTREPAASSCKAR